MLYDQSGGDDYESRTVKCDAETNHCNGEWWHRLVVGSFLFITHIFLMAFVEVDDDG